MNMKRLLTSLIVLISALSMWSAETGLFTYEGGFFVKNGNIWKEYRPKENPEYGLHTPSITRKRTSIILRMIIVR